MWLDFVSASVNSVDLARPPPLPLTAYSHNLAEMEKKGVQNLRDAGELVISYASKFLTKTLVVGAGTMQAGQRM